MIYLASGSPRRKELLAAAGYQFEVKSPNIDESVQSNETPEAYVTRLSIAKAQHVFNQVSTNDVVIAADTSVVYQNQILGKPVDKEDAFAMWAMLSNQLHHVLTGVTVMSSALTQSFVVTTDVSFAAMSQDDMQWYWNTQEPLDKAGAYAIQGIGGQYVQSIKGSYSNVVGLPLFETLAILRQLDLRPSLDPS